MSSGYTKSSETLPPAEYEELNIKTDNGQTLAGREKSLYETQGASRDRTPEELAPSFLPWVMKMARMPVRVAGFNKLASVSPDWASPRPRCLRRGSASWACTTLCT